MGSGAPREACQARHAEWAGTHIFNRAIVDKNSNTQTAVATRTTLPQKTGSNRVTWPLVFITTTGLLSQIHQSDFDEASFIINKATTLQYWF
jgi:hypothetical protein